MANIEEAQALVATLLEQEKRLQFTKFTSQDALDLGLKILETVKTKYDNRPVAIDITVNGLILFRHAMDGTSPDNEMWIKRKSNAVNRFRHSSYWLGNALIIKNKSLEKAYFISEVDYATHGGSVPLIIKNVGMIGTITVTGLKQHEDHGVIIECLEYMLSKA
ncbi:uncharacterized protein BX664DRAFT_302825 [Halteromyces radiatus]|uniref:uncharacterized protein n=1 Tax=Halteromyces radiatus TaxID=101107 RepID=UPI002220D0EA|nr:uncharacterized protein BX664DRAFT_302825 [Halteromyces radiatus]KAI8079758.1 hypothetical protein BX664DRAFT_302825 [Halteromyces radiatus]